MSNIYQESINWCYMKLSQAAHILWDYLFVQATARQADIIIVCGSEDVRVAEYAAELYAQGFAQRIVMSGDKGRGTQDFSEPESQVFARKAQEHGVPEDAILQERASTNTGENIQNVKQLLRPAPMSAIVIHKPYMVRRTQAILKQLWPELRAIVLAPPIGLSDYEQEDVYARLAGEVERIILYPERGYQVPQDVPLTVQDAYALLVQAGYTRHLL